MSVLIFCYLLLFLAEFIAIISPLHVRGTPGESSSESGEDDVVALLELRLILPETKRQCTTAGIGEMVDIDHHLAFGQVDAFSHGRLDTDVSLVRYERSGS